MVLNEGEILKTALVTTFILFPAFTWASQVSYTNTRVPFSCNDSASFEIAQDSLANSCKEQGLVLTSASSTTCEDAGGDGGYVEYYAVTYVGTCGTVQSPTR